MVLSEPVRRLTFALAESNTKFTATLVVATLLHTRAPTGKLCGPAVGLLLSRPITFQVIGETVRVACAEARGSSPAMSATRARRKRRCIERGPPADDFCRANTGLPVRSA